MPHCKALYNHLFVDVQGFYAPCCSYTEKKKHSYKDLSYNDYHNSDYMNNIRKNMLDGWDKGCNECEELEKQNLESYRHIVARLCESDEPRIEYIEISCSNKCNIRCRMCKPDFSSKWAETFEIVVPHIENFKEFLSQIDTTHIKVIKYLGGEPFITPEIKILLDWMITLPNPVKFHCNTNLTLFPKKYIDTLSKLDQVIIGYSIDGVGAVNDYIRQDSDWKTIEQNLELWEKSKNVLNLKSYVHTTLQAYNFHNLSELKSICDKYELHHGAWKIFEPKEFTLNALPQHYIDTHTDEYSEQFIKDYKYNSELHAQLIEKTKQQDRLLQTSIANFIPELAEFI